MLVQLHQGVHYIVWMKKASGCIPVTEVEEAAVVIWVLILKAQVRPAAQTVISYTQLLGHSGLSGFPAWRATCTEMEGHKQARVSEIIQMFVK